MFQVDNLRKHVQTSGISKRVELVITSPLLRYTLCFISWYRLSVTSLFFFSFIMNVSSPFVEHVHNLMLLGGSGDGCLKKR